MKQTIAVIKPYLRWFIFGGIIFFLLKHFKESFAEIATIEIDNYAWLFLVIGLIITLLAHVWSGWVWTWILAIFRQSLTGIEGICIYLVTNIAKYLPGNVWHFYGRITAVSQKGGSLGAATLSVLLEPLLMAASALLIAIFSTSLGLVATEFNLTLWLGQILVLIIVLIGIHPRILNPILSRLSRIKKNQELTQLVALKTYPLLPFLGEIIFVLFRGIGFMFVFMTLQSITPQQIPSIISAFSIAWLLGLVVPGAPGGIGVFEATAIALLDESHFPPATVLLVVALYRVISVLAEAIAAGGAWIISKTFQDIKNY